MRIHIYCLLIGILTLIYVFPASAQKSNWWKAIRFKEVPMSDDIVKKEKITDVVPCFTITSDNVIWTGRGTWLSGWNDPKGIWTHYNINDTVVAVCADAKDKIWIGTSGHKLICFDLEAKKILSTMPLKDIKNDVSRIREIFVDAVGDKWIGTDEGLIKVSEREKSIEKIWELKDYKIHSIARHEGTLYVATDNGLFALQNKEWKPQRGFDRRNIGHFGSNPADEKLMVLFGDKVDIIMKKDAAIGKDSSGRYKFTDALCDFNGRVWGTNLGGVYGWVENGGWHYFNDINSELKVNKALVIKEDNLGMLWIGADEGLWRLLEPSISVTPTTPAIVNSTDTPGNPSPAINDTNSIVNAMSDNYLVLLLDISASMQTSITRMGIAFNNILKYLRPNDKISIVTFASKSEIVAEDWKITPGNKARIGEIFDGFEYKGSTNIRAGLAKAHQVAKAYKIPNGNNRIIVVSDANFEVEKQFSILSEIANSGISVSVFCAQKKTVPQTQALEKFAKMGRGNYYNFAVGSGKMLENAFWNEITGK